MLFIANALVFATIVTRYPEFKDRFELSALTFGLLVACGPVGSVARQRDRGVAGQPLPPGSRRHHVLR